MPSGHLSVGKTNGTRRKVGQVGGALYQRQFRRQREPENEDNGVPTEVTEATEGGKDKIEVLHSPRVQNKTMDIFVKIYL